jgi:hypothetical protein
LRGAGNPARSGGSDEEISTRSPVVGWVKPRWKACKKKRPEGNRRSTVP